MSKTAYVFPGQGSQVVGMGKALAGAFPEAREVLEAADDALGERLSSLCFEGPVEALTLTRNTQPAILAISAAVHAVLSRRAPPPDFMAGHSLGEYSALVAAGALPLGEAVRAVRARGTFMQEAVAEGQGAMAAVLGLGADEVLRICERAGEGQVVSPANYNAPGQTVIAGAREAVERASAALKEAGAKRVIPLPVSAPFHCALMAPVQPRLREVLEAIELRAPKVPVVTNVEAAPTDDPARIVSLLVEQVTSPVRWVESVKALERLGVSRVVEVGPGKVLSALVKRISSGFEVLNVEDPGSLQQALTRIGG